MDDKKLKLVVEDKDPRQYPELPKVSKLRLNLNGHKKRHGKNQYKRKLGRLRRTLRW